MRRFIVLLIITGTVWAQTSLDKLVLDDGTEFLGEYSGVMENMVYFKPSNALAFHGVPINRIRSLQLKDGKTIIEDEYIKISTILNYKHLSIKDKATYDAKKDARRWILYPPAAFSLFVSSIYGTLIIARKEPWESLPTLLGISVASLTIPHLLFRELTSKKTENFNSKDKQLYEKIYLEEYKRRKYKNIMISAGATALIAGAVTFHVLSNLSLDFGPNTNLPF